MPNSSSTVVIDSSQTTNAPAALAYGYVWVTGKRLSYFELQNTGNDDLDFTRVGFWCLGEGEWDGNEELWINNYLIWKSEFGDPAQFHFHHGTDATIGSGLVPSSVGPDQGCDSFWKWFPSGTNPLCFSRLAYYGIFRKQAIENPTNDHQNDPTQWTDINPVGLWRSMRVRLFDDQGNQTGYAFSTNPVWQWVDLKLRRKLFPEYNISLLTGADPIPAAVAACFNWGDLWASAQYCDQLIPTGIGPRPRFRGNFAFASQTTTTAIEEQMLLCCRGYTRQYAGKWSLLIDQPRASVFTVSRAHVLPGSFAPSDKSVSQAPNSYVGKFRDLLVPACAAIASITCADHSNPELTTEEPHPLDTGDRIAIGGTNTLYDGVWSVLSIPEGTEITTAQLVSKGSNYPASVGAGGSVGLLQSRFKERAPTFAHQNSQYARGAVGVGIPRQLNPLPVSYDFAVATFDQVSRVTRYERDRALGLDVSPYVTPPALTFKCPMYALDAAGSGNCAAQIQTGDRITIDPTASWSYQGDYEVLKKTVRSYTAQPASAGNSIALRAAPDSGVLDLTLGPYNETAMYDYTDPNTAGWSNVPGSDPGNDGNYTGIDLADSGKLAFLTLSMQSGSTFDLPSTGFDSANLLAWAGPQGYIELGAVMHVIALCDVNTSTRVGTLQYEDGEGSFWVGDLNVAAVTWSGDSTAATLAYVSSGDVPLQWLMLTLAGGEQVCFGCGVVPDGTTLELPAGFTTAQMFAVAFPHDASPSEPGASGNQAHGVGAYVDGSQVVHLNYQDGEGHVWHGNARVLAFAWKNNSGEVTTETTGGATWMKYTTSTGFVLGVGMGTYEDSTSMALPTVAGAGNSLQVIAGPHDFTIVDHPAHGVGACYVDANLAVHCVFEDGEGNVWTGHADVFALFYEPTGGSGSAAGGITVSVSPSGVAMVVSGTQQFTAQVAGSSDTAVEWSVDGVAGGSSTVGTIDTTGLYTAPATSGTHQITATSHANAAALGWQFVQVGTGSGASGGGGSGVSITVSPSYASVPIGGTQQFTATITGATGSPTVTWAVNGVAGGNSTVGTISGTGLYTAPSTSTGVAITASAAGAIGGASASVGSGGSSGGVGGGTGGGGRGSSTL
jgi:hypothetical protein